MGEREGLSPSSMLRPHSRTSLRLSRLERLILRRTVFAVTLQTAVDYTMTICHISVYPFSVGVGSDIGLSSVRIFLMSIDPPAVSAHLR